METLFTGIALLALGYILIDVVIRILRGPYRCSCGFETYNPDEALRHQGQKSHTVE